MSSAQIVIDGFAIDRTLDYNPELVKWFVNQPRHHHHPDVSPLDNREAAEKVAFALPDIRKRMCPYGPWDLFVNGCHRYRGDHVHCDWPALIGI